MKFKWLLMCFYSLSVVGLLIYLKGFFPVKISRVGFSSRNDVPPPPSDSGILLQLSNEDFQNTYEGLTMEPSKKLPRNFTKLVLVVINALREDFVYGGHHLPSTPFLHKLLMQGDMAEFVSRAQAPAVTIPRIKALVTGSVPSYADVILSLDQPKELKEDNLITSALADGRSVIFYGDDTWTKLFPGKFKREDGVSPFFINEYKTVDNNVTRHLEKELSHADNFDIMILHYLGLGHIGHIAGSKSPLIDTKLKEMDFVIQQIYEGLEKHDKEKGTNSLIVVTGDHGMTDKGSHGGTTQHERNVPLMFLSPGITKNSEINTEPSEVQQTDLVATLSILFGLPIPRNSMGKVIQSLVERMNPSDQLHALEYNCHHLLSLAGKTGLLEKDSFEIVDPLKLYSDSILSHATWLQHPDIADKKFKEAKEGYALCQQAVSDQLMYHVASYNHMLMGAGMVLMWLAYLAIIASWGRVVLSHEPPIKNEDGGNSANSPLTWGVLVTLGMIIHGLSLLSSSFLEEEHQTWYFVTATFLMVLFISVMSDQVSVRLGMAETVPKGFFSKRRNSPAHTGPNRHETMDLLRRAKSDDSEGVTWDFVELEPDNDKEYTFDRAKKITSPDSDLATAGVLVASVLTHRILRGWNSTGIQNVDQPDIGDWLNEPDHRMYLLCGHFLGLICTALLLEVLTQGKDNWRRCLTSFGFVMVFMYRVTAADALSNEGQHSADAFLAGLTYLTVVVIIGRAIFLKSQFSPKLSATKTMDYVISSIVLLSSLLLRAHNIWGLVFNLFLYWSIFRQLWPILNEDSKSSDSNLQMGKIVLRTTLCYWFGQMGYFSLGNSNSLSTIDVSAGYVGISSHSGTLEDNAVRFLILFATYIGPIIWTVLCLADAVDVTSKESSSSKHSSSQALLAVFSTFAFLRLTPMAFYLILVTAMRYHLFVWSVFAPKLLFETASTVIYGLMLLAACAAAKWIM